MKARDWIREAKAKKKSKGHGHSTLHQGNCQPPILPVSDYGFSAANRSRAIGLPNHFQYEGLVHPITLDLCAARKTIPFFKPPIATVGSSYFFRPKIKSLGFGFNYRVPGLVGWVLKGRENGGMLGGLDME